MEFSDNKKTPIHNIEWLIDPGETSLTSSTISAASKTKKIHFPYPPEIATGFSEHTQTRDGIVLVQDTHNFIPAHCPPTIPLANFSVQFPEPVLALSMVHTGQVLMTNLKSKETQLRQSGADCFTHCVDYSIEQIVKTNEKLVTTGLIIPITQLRKLVDDENITMLFERLDIQELQSFRIHQMPPSISKILESCVDHSLTDSVKAMQLQARFLDYLCSLILHIGSEIVTTQNQNPAKARARAIHNFLINAGAETPTLTDLGEKFGGSPNKLNAEFMNEYGESIFSFLTNYRLEQARLAIEQSGQPLKVIAHRIGYSHVNHFITAFKRKYNVTPGSLRQ